MQYLSTLVRLKEHCVKMLNGLQEQQARQIVLPIHVFFCSFSLNSFSPELFYNESPKNKNVIGRESLSPSIVSIGKKPRRVPLSGLCEITLIDLGSYL